MTISNAASASLEANPFVGEGGAYASVRPAYPDGAVAALLASARSRGGVTGGIEPAAGDPADSPSVEEAPVVPAPAALATVPPPPPAPPPAPPPRRETRHSKNAHRGN